ncbi:MAG: N-6 DNA methylase [Paludibacteraceae bacterium]|nr:N-6 DNA methylase [Paludibacteraceae bacterium]
MVIMNESLIYQAHYTKSDPILNYMTGILDFKPQDSIFEPCGGDGVFVDKILEKSPLSKICIYELNPTAVDVLRSKYKHSKNIRIKETDTLLDNDIVLGRCKFDKIIGNPPYGARNDVAKKNELNRLYANLYTKESYTLFLYACIKCLNENGELSFIIPDTFLSLHRHLEIRKFILTHTAIRELVLFPSSFFPGINFGYANLCIITLSKCSDISSNLRNKMIIRTDFSKVDELENSKAGTIREISQEAILNGVGSAFMFNSSDELKGLINDESLTKIGDIASCVTGFYSGCDKEYLRPLNSDIKNAKKYKIVDCNTIYLENLSNDEKRNGINSERCFVPIVKGGNTKYVKPNTWFMDWSIKAINEYHKSKKCRFQNSTFYFRNGIGIPMIRSSKLTGALIDGRLFDQSIVGVFPNDESLVNYMLAFFNSSVCTNLINAINPSTNNSANYIKKIPFIIPTKSVRKEIEILVGCIVERLKNGEEQIDDIETQIDNVFDNLYLGKKGVDKKASTKPIYKQYDLFGLFSQYGDNNIVENAHVCKDCEIEYGQKQTEQRLAVDLKKNLLICNVKKDNLEQYLNGSAKIYYTGKKFPTTIALNKLYYFMPYISGKGIRDLYYIKIARLGYRKEGQENENKNDIRLVFEIERIGQLFNDYKKIKLEIWRTFTDTTLDKLLYNIGEMSEWHSCRPC